MAHFSNSSLSPVEEGPSYDDFYNNTQTSVTSSDRTDSHLFYVFFMLPIISIIGLPGNGIVIYFLGFHIKRSPFTTYILNLAVADFGVLLFFLITFFLLLFCTDFLLLGLVPATFMQSSSQLLLTAISIDRCVAILFPIWHRCHRPPHLSTIVCALMWVLACLPPGSLAISYYYFLEPSFFAYPFIAVSVLCLLLITMSTMILFPKVFCKVQRPHRGRVLTIVSLTLILFLIFAFPPDAFLTFSYFMSSFFWDLIVYGCLCAILNSCVNPVVYYMVGRKRRGQQRQSLKVVLQRAFKEEEGQRQEQGPTAQTSL